MDVYILMYLQHSPMNIRVCLSFVYLFHIHEMYVRTF